MCHFGRYSFSTAIDLLCACLFGCKNTLFVLFVPGCREGRRTGIKLRKAHQMPCGYVLSNGDGAADGQACHAERSEASQEQSSGDVLSRASARALIPTYSFRNPPKVGQHGEHPREILR